jgi:GT2 family glycosyltransferase
LTLSCSVVIPAIEINKDVIKCVKECLSQEKTNVTLYLVTNKKSKFKFKSKKVKCLYYGDVTMSKKRNLAVKKSKDKYIAFIDSDAYPAKKWILNGVKLLKKDNQVAMVTGPDLPFKNQKGWSYIISLAHKSFLLSGSKIFRKNIKNERICKQASSCNMILKRDIYNNVGGMDEKIYIGEDKDLCDKISDYFKILYSPKVKIFHKVRDFVPFILQRFSYGTCITDIIKNNKKISFNNFQYFVPMMIVFYYLLLPFSIANNFFVTLFLTILIFLNLIIILESIRITFNPIKFIKIFFIINLNIFAFGLGSIMFFLGIDKIKKIYTKR